jgi:hypothetical protein
MSWWQIGCSNPGSVTSGAEFGDDELEIVHLGDEIDQLIGGDFEGSFYDLLF